MARDSKDGHASAFQAPCWRLRFLPPHRQASYPRTEHPRFQCLSWAFLVYLSL